MSNNTSFFSPDNVSTPCSLDATKREYDACKHAIFVGYIIIVILSPVAVVGNALILAAVWKKTFERTPFYVLLSGLAFTDLCTGIISQPLIGGPSVLYPVNTKVFVTQTGLIKTVSTVGFVSALYLGIIALLIITLMSIERWWHMSRRSLVSPRRVLITFIVLFLIRVPLVVFSALNFTTPERSRRDWRVTIAALMLFCYLTTSVAYFKVFRIIRQHQQQVHGNQSFQNLAKYKRSVVSILCILAVFSFCFLPMIITLAVTAQVGSNPHLSAAYVVSLAMLFYLLR